MDIKGALLSLEIAWHDFLVEQGHHVYPEIDQPEIISYNSKKTRYRWLLMVGQGLKRRFTKSERIYLERKLRLASSKKETTYLVVGFIRQPTRIIVLPVANALKAKCVYSNKGGIAWNEWPLEI